MEGNGNVKFIEETTHDVMCMMSLDILVLYVRTYVRMYKYYKVQFYDIFQKLFRAPSGHLSESVFPDWRKKSR